jgi:ABC-2 type transport system ATP-binding protein
VIAAAHLTRRFGKRTVVDNLTFEVGRSEIVALLGPNGAGKTTTMRMLAGLIAPTSGAVLIDGVRLTRSTGSALRRRIGFLTEAPGLWDRLTVHENLAVYAGIYSIERPEAAIGALLELFDLAAHARARAAELSKGMRQKLALARTMLHDPHVLLLDEPTSALDPEVTRSVRRLLEERRANGCTILLSTHNLDEAERLADRVAVIQARLVALDTPASLRRRLTTGRVIVRTREAVAPKYLTIARRFDAAATAENGEIILTLKHGEVDTPVLVRQLVTAGAEILEVRPEMPALEDVYLHLMADERRNGGAA